VKKDLPALAILAALYIGWGLFGDRAEFQGPAPAANEAVATAFRDERRGVQVTGEGVVTRILADDDDGSRHQRFILDLGSGHTVLVAHNIDLAPRVADLAVGDAIAFNGEYEWNRQGGVIHWTHHDPNGRHEPGWLKHHGKIFQ
jgi:hypothetical protein